MDALETRVSLLEEKVVTGNGHASLMERVALLEQANAALAAAIENEKAEREKEKAERKATFRWILGTLATGLLGQGAALWKLFGKG